MNFALICALVGCQQLLTPEETKAVDAVIVSLVKAGFPDAAKAVAYSGKIAIRVTFDPDKEPSPLPSHASDYQATIPDSKKMTYGFTFEGLHFKLADGSWLIGFTHRFKPRDGDSVKVLDETPVDMKKLTSDAAAAHPFDAATDAAAWLEWLAPAHRDRCAKALNRFVPVSHHLKILANDWAPAILLFHAAGWTDAADAVVEIADRRAREYWQLRPWNEPDFIFDPKGEYPTAKEREEAWEKATKELRPETPDVALRRAVFRWCQAQVMAEHPMIAPEAAAAICKAALDPKDPQKHAARIDALLAGSRLPLVPAEGASLVARLESWEARTRKPRMKVTSGKDGTSMATSFELPTPAYEPKKVDLDALVALLGDERPSRFFDFSGPRPVGDNAWRAVAMLLKADPRTLAGIPIDRPWTAAERASASASFQKWWKDHRGEHVEK